MRREAVTSLETGALIQRDTIRNVPVMRQLELSLISEAECAADAWKYRFTSDALVEEVDSKRVVYGLWGKLFGCWVTNPATGQWREIIPTWQPLSQNGVWRDQRDIRFLADDERRRPYSSRWRCEANAAFAGYFAEIPQRVRSVVAAMGHYQWLALDLIWHEPDFAQFLDEELFNDRQQYLFACFGLGDAVNLPRARRREFARTLMGGKRTDVLSELLKSGCKKSNLRSIYKLGEEPCDPVIYKKLIRLSANPSVSKALSHAEHISARAIEFLWNLPEEYLLPKLMRMILDQGLAIDEIDTDHEANGHRRSPQHPPNAYEAAHKSDDESDHLNRDGENIRWPRKMDPEMEGDTDPVDRLSATTDTGKSSSRPPILSQPDET